MDRSKEATIDLTRPEEGCTPGLEPFVEICRSRWPDPQNRPQVIARAPGRLDCMGGMADFSGALALQMPIEQGAYVAAGRRNDQNIFIESIGWGQDGDSSRSKWPLSWLYHADGQLASSESFAQRFDGNDLWVRHVAGVCLAMLGSDRVPHLAGGVTLFIQSDIPPEAGLASSSAIEVATAKALAGLFDVELADPVLLDACRSANTKVVGAAPGLVDHLTCLRGEADALLQIRCQPDNVLGVMELPNEIKFVAVDSGLRLPIYHDRYRDNRVASILGKFLIEQMLRSSGGIGDPTGGYLANISPNEYVRRFRNELPVKLRGRDFIAEFGQPESLDVTIDPDRIYKVRSRTEHHIYENDRTYRLMERLARARRTATKGALIEAGELMYASHWSYGQRCGMGSIETDILVNIIRERGLESGFYGAKVTGAGCGGAVAVLMANQESAATALDEACIAYEAKTGKRAVVIDGSSPGAAAFGIRVLDESPSA